MCWQVTLTLLSKTQTKKLSTAWKKGFDGILDAYLGEEPEKFEYKGKEYPRELSLTKLLV